MKIKHIYIISVAVCFLCALVFHPIEYNDTPSYLSAWNTLSSGRWDTFRTPLYPVVLGVARNLLGKVWKWGVMIIQYGVFLLSIKYFHHIASSLLKERWALIMTAFYAIYPTFNSWGNLLLTDSLGLSLSVLFFYNCFRIINNGSVKHTFLMASLLLLLLALRPSSISLLIPAAISFFLVLFTKEKRSAGIVGLAGIAVCSALLIAYSFNIKERTGVFTPSTVSVSNDFAIARIYGYLSPEAANERADVLRQNYEKYGEELMEGPILYGALGDLTNEFSVAEMKQLVDKSIRSNPILWLKALIKRTYLAALTPSMTSYTSDLFRLHPLFPINIGIVLLLMVIYCIIIIISTLKEHFPLVNFFLLITCLCVIGVSIVGAQYEYHRLILPAMPLVLIIRGQLLQRISIVLHE